MGPTGSIIGESTDSFEDAARQVAEQLRQPNIADQLIEFEISRLSYKEGGFVGFPPTYIVEAAAPTE